MSNTRISVSFLTLFFVFALHGLNKPYVKNIYKDDYNAKNKNWAIDQDEIGVIYVANDGGLLEYDGVEWRLNSLSANFVIRSLAVKSHDTIFTGGYQEFGRWDRDISGNLVYTSLSSNIDKSLFRNDDFWKIQIDTSCVYFQSFNAIYIYDYHKIKRIPFNNGFLFLSKIRDEYLIQEMRGMLYRLKDTSLEQIEGSEIFSQTDVRVILPFGKNKYLIGTAINGIYIYDGHTFEIWNKQLSALISEKELNCGILTHSGTYVFGTISDGIYEADPEGRIVNHISTHNSLQNNTVLSLFEDRVHYIWVGMDRGIASLCYIDKMDCYIAPRGNIPAVYDAVELRNCLFLATNQGVYYLLAEELKLPNTLERLKLINGTQGQVWKLRVIDNKLYCCHNRGLKYIHTDLTVTDMYGVGTGVYDIFEKQINNQSRIILSTYNSVRFIDKKKGEMFMPDMIHEPIVSVETDHLDNLWLEHFNTGIYRCKLNEEGTDIVTYATYEGDKGNLLPYKLKFFKVGGRMVFYGNNKFFSYNDVDDRIVPDSELNKCFLNIQGIKNVIRISFRVFWAVTTNAIYKFRYDGYDAEIIETYLFDTALSLNNNYENLSRLNDSTSLVCLDNGFFIYHEKQYKKNKPEKMITPHLSVLEVSNVNGNKMFFSMDEQVKIPYTFNTVLFRFSSIEMLSNNVSFQYKLDNIDANWINVSKTNNASYERLPAGEYRFELRTVDKTGRISDTASSCFVVLKPWYQTNWAYLLYVVTFSSVLYGIWMLVLRRYRNIHLQKIRARETNRLKSLTNRLQQELKQKNAELLTQASFIIQKNELIFDIRDELNDYAQTHSHKDVRSLTHKLNELLDNVDSEKDWKMFLIKFEVQHTNFFRNLKLLYPQLTSNDLRLCACLKLNLGSKEIASLLNLSVRAVENSRYRLRKKLNLDPIQNLNEFIIYLD